MPKAPMLDPSTVGQSPSLLEGGQGVTPEHVLMAAEMMHSQGRLIDQGAPPTLGPGPGGIKMPHRMKPSAGRRTR